MHSQSGYPEADATWQFANTLDDCAAVDVWEEQKKHTTERRPAKASTNTADSADRDADAEGEDDDDGQVGKSVGSPAALVTATVSG